MPFFGARLYIYEKYSVFLPHISAYRDKKYLLKALIIEIFYHFYGTSIPLMANSSIRKMAWIFPHKPLNKNTCSNKSYAI